MADEEKNGKEYLQEARMRARRRKSPVNLLLPLVWLPLLFFIWYGQVSFFHRLFGASCTAENVFRCLPDKGMGVVLFTVSLLFPAMLLAMVLTNFLLHAVPPVRRVLDREAEEFPETSFIFAQISLIKATGVICLIAWGLSYIGFLLM